MLNPGFSPQDCINLCGSACLQSQHARGGGKGVGIQDHPQQVRGQSSGIDENHS